MVGTRAGARPVDADPRWAAPWGPVGSAVRAAALTVGGLTPDSLSRFAMALRESPARPAWTLLASGQHRWTPTNWRGSDGLMPGVARWRGARVGYPVLPSGWRPWCALDGDAPPPMTRQGEHGNSSSGSLSWRPTRLCCRPRQTLLMSMESKRHSPSRPRPRPRPLTPAKQRRLRPSCHHSPRKRSGVGSRLGWLRSRRRAPINVHWQP